MPITTSEKDGVFYRHYNFRATEGQKTLDIVAATDDTVDMGGFREVLSHEEGAIDWETATALLYNHNRDYIIGSVSEFAVEDGELRSKGDIIESAVLPSSITAREAVDSGALRGVSIGYTYRYEDVKYDDDTETLYVLKWRLLEITLTPTPADKNAGLRSRSLPTLPDDSGETQRSVRMPDPNTDPVVQPDLDVAAIEKGAREAAEKKAREAAEAREAEIKDIIERAKNYGLDAGDYITMSRAEAVEKMADALAERAKPTEPKDPVTSVTRDAGDKFIERAAAGLCNEENGIALSSLAIARRCAEMSDSSARDWSDDEVANFTLRTLSFNGQRAANKSTSSFSVLLGNTSNKQLISGFDSYEAVYKMFCTIKQAKDFNTHNHVGVASGRLVETAENVAYPELDQAEGSYSSALAMFGATQSITYQALINDELGDIMAKFFKTGFIAAQTIDYQAFYALLNGTYTNDVTTGAALGTAGNLDAVRADFKGKLSPAGIKMEINPKVLVVAPANLKAAQEATGNLYTQGNGGDGALNSNAGRSYTVVDSTFVGDTSLKAGALTTDYYLCADPRIVDTVTVEFLRGVMAPQIIPFDAGATDAVKYKIRLPLKATLATHTDSDGNSRVSGVQKATVA